ncbi:MAG: hypothetical protein HY719_04865 [Planctomycetes bacterium]|nr:hypothetical protein [Planctomycetota bacterium]
MDRLIRYTQYFQCWDTLLSEETDAERAVASWIPHRWQRQLVILGAVEAPCPYCDGAGRSEHLVRSSYTRYLSAGEVAGCVFTCDLCAGKPQWMVFFENFGGAVLVAIPGKNEKAELANVSPLRTDSRARLEIALDEFKLASNGPNPEIVGVRDLTGRKGSDIIYLTDTQPVLFHQVFDYLHGAWRHATRLRPAHFGATLVSTGDLAPLEEALGCWDRIVHVARKGPWYARFVCMPAQPVLHFQMTVGRPGPRCDPEFVEKLRAAFPPHPGAGRPRVWVGVRESRRVADGDTHLSAAFDLVKRKYPGARFVLQSMNLAAARNNFPKVLARPDVDTCIGRPLADQLRWCNGCHLAIVEHGSGVTIPMALNKPMVELISVQRYQMMGWQRSALPRNLYRWVSGSWTEEEKSVNSDFIVSGERIGGQTLHLLDEMERAGVFRP